MYAKLVFSILKYFPEQESSSRLFLLSEVRGHILLLEINLTSTIMDGKGEWY
jgi:hypothetical protein